MLKLEKFCAISTSRPNPPMIATLNKIVLKKSFFERKIKETIVTKMVIISPTGKITVFPGQCIISKSTPLHIIDNPHPMAIEPIRRRAEILVNDSLLTFSICILLKIAKPKKQYIHANELNEIVVMIPPPGNIASLKTIAAANIIPNIFSNFSIFITIRLKVLRQGAQRVFPL